MEYYQWWIVSTLMHYLKLISCIKLKNQKIKTLNIFCIVENSPKVNEENFGLSVSPVLSGGHMDFAGEDIFPYILLLVKWILTKFTFLLILTIDFFDELGIIAWKKFSFFFFLFFRIQSKIFSWKLFLHIPIEFKFNCPLRFCFAFSNFYT